MPDSEWGAIYLELGAKPVANAKLTPCSSKLSPSA